MDGWMDGCSSQLSPRLYLQVNGSLDLESSYHVLEWLRVCWCSLLVRDTQSLLSEWVSEWVNEWGLTNYIHQVIMYHRSKAAKRIPKRVGKLWWHTFRIVVACTCCLLWVFLMLVVIIHLMAPAPSVMSFPPPCTSTDHCAWVTPDHSQNNLTAPVYRNVRDGTRTDPSSTHASQSVTSIQYWQCIDESTDGSMAFDRQVPRSSRSTLRHGSIHNRAPWCSTPR